MRHEECFQCWEASTYRLLSVLGVEFTCPRVGSIGVCGHDMVFGAKPLRDSALGSGVADGTCSEPYGGEAAAEGRYAFQSRQLARSLCLRCIVTAPHARHAASA